MKRNDYVVGFLFDTDGRQVLLITKERPNWQQGCLNGLGGEIKEGETPGDAMVREFKQECDLDGFTWRLFAIKHGIDSKFDPWRVFFFAANDYAKQMPMARQTTDEKIDLYIVDALPDNILNDLRYLIPMALTPIRSDAVLAIREVTNNESDNVTKLSPSDAGRPKETTN